MWINFRCILSSTLLLYLKHLCCFDIACNFELMQHSGITLVCAVVKSVAEPIFHLSRVTFFRAVRFLTCISSRE